MWGFTTAISWHPWVGAAPDVSLAQLLAADPAQDFVALVGAAKLERGRFGVVGVPMAVRFLGASEAFVRRAFDVLPTDTLRVVLLGYELGAVAVQLAVPPSATPYGLEIDLAAFLLVDHALQRMAWHGCDDLALQALKSRYAPGTQVVPDAAHATLEPTVSDALHAQRIAAALTHIAAGDIYQANLSRPLRVMGPFDASAALQRLADINPVAHAAHVRVAGVELLSNSMETLLTYAPQTRAVCSWPIKGTCARAPDGGDTAQGEALINHPKEQAEHVMIVDLVRNDLGKVCKPGSVHVAPLMAAQPYRGVWHAESAVRGTLGAAYTLGQLVLALFPGGSITGAPKRRAMQIIAALEGAGRGFYTGSLALVAPSGRLSMSILIRTLVRDACGWQLAVGGGIVADSTATRELAETWEKAGVFMQILGCTAAGISNVDTL